MLVISLWMLVNSQINPPKPKPNANAATDVKAIEDDKAATEEEATTNDDGTKAPPRPEIARQHVTLGSLNAASGYTMLVTFDNHGAGVERIEMSGDHYHDMERRGGYLGYLALVDEEAGPVIHAVGDGTPASLGTAPGVTGGIAKDDRLISINGEPIDSAAGLAKYLDKKTKPKDVVQVEVERGSGAGASRIAFSVTLTRAPLALVQREDNSIANSFVDKDKPAEPVGPVSFRMGLKQVDEATAKTGDNELKGLPSLYDSSWNVTVLEDGTGVEFWLDLSEADLKKIGASGDLRVIKRYRLANTKDGAAGPKQHLTLEVEIENRSEKETDISYRLEGPNGLPTEGWWYYVKVHPGWAGAGARDVAYDLGGTHYLAGLPAIVSEADKQLAAKAPPVKVLLGPNDERRLRYVASDTQYFAVAMVPEKVLERNAASNPQLNSVLADAFPLNRAREKTRNKLTNTSFRLTSAVEKIPPGAKLTDKYVIFAGPKDQQLLDQYGLGGLIEYGWFGIVSRLLSKILWSFHWVTGSYGISIILLTVLVRGAMLPISLRQAKGMAKMEALKPEMEKIKEKYKGDQVKQQQEVSELWRKHNVNPLAGCGPMVLQLPVFIGLYRCLSSDINMRETPLIQGMQWCANLAGPDFLFEWKEYLPAFLGDEANGWLGPYFNILPLFTIALFIIQQKMFTPPPANEEQEIQQKIMTWMTVFMGVMFYKVPAGLCIYFITSSIWGIVERKMLPKPQKNRDGTFKDEEAEKKDEPPQPNKPSSDDNRTAPGKKKLATAEPSFMEKFSTWVTQLNDAAEGKGASREARNGRDTNPNRKDSSGDRSQRKDRGR